MTEQLNWTNWASPSVISRDRNIPAIPFLILKFLTLLPTANQTYQMTTPWLTWGSIWQKLNILLLSPNTICCFLPPQGQFQVTEYHQCIPSPTQTWPLPFQIHCVHNHQLCEILLSSSSLHSGLCWPLDLQFYTSTPHKQNKNSWESIMIFQRIHNQEWF